MAVTWTDTAPWNDRSGSARASRHLRERSSRSAAPARGQRPVARGALRREEEHGVEKDEAEVRTTLVGGGRGDGGRGPGSGRAGIGHGGSGPDGGVARAAAGDRTAYAEAANPGAAVVFARAQIVKPGVIDQWDFVFMVNGTTRYGVSLKNNGSFGWKSTVPNCLFPVPCESLRSRRGSAPPRTRSRRSPARTPGSPATSPRCSTARIPRSPNTTGTPLLRDVHDGRLHRCPHLEVRPRAPNGRASVLIRTVGPQR